MPATERSFASDLPSQLYIDTNVIIAYLIIDREPHHARCRSFLQRIAVARATIIYISNLTRVEFVHVITRVKFRSKLSAAYQQLYQLDRWDQDINVRRHFVGEHLRLLQELLDQFGDWIELVVDQFHLELANDYIVQYGVDGNDGVHLALMMEEGIADVATLDHRFREVDDIFVWNDLIHP